MKLFNLDKDEESGQVIIVLLLIMLVALSVGLAMTQRSITNLSTSSQTEQAARAFSAAEAGIEKVIQGGAAGETSFTLGNQSTAKVTVSQLLPQSNIGLEYVPVGKDDIAQFWLSDPSNFNQINPALAPSPYYRQPNFQIYFGNPDLGTSNPDYPAIEVNVLTYNPANSQYSLNQSVYDSAPSNFRRDSSNNPVDNGFYQAGVRGECNKPETTTASNAGIKLSTFYCRVNVPCQDSNICSIIPSSHIPIMVRTRILYSSAKKQKVAVVPLSGACPGSCLPPQATLYTSTGTAGQSQKTLTTVKYLSVIPNFFDFAIFSTGNINK